MPFRSVVEARLKPNAATGRRIRWSERPGPWTNMRTLLRFALAWLIVGHAAGGLNSQGPQCGDVRCSAFEHCSDYHGQCEHCSSVCDETDTNYQLEVCQRKCQAYDRHMRALLRGDVERLWTLVTIATVLASLSLLATACFMLERLAFWKKLRGAFRRGFSRKWVKRATNSGTGSNNNNNNREAQTDAEAGLPRQNGLKLTMPTISASVAPTRNGSSNGSSGSGSATGIANNSTPNTTITTLSRRHPSEDTTLDYAYDNPAMTPSPEAVQLRTKRESSF